MTLGGSELQKK